MDYLGTYKIPTYAVCYLEYGENDSSDVTGDDVRTIETWLQKTFYDEGKHHLYFDWPDSNTDDWENCTVEFDTDPVFGLTTSTIETKVYGNISAEVLGGT